MNKYQKSAIAFVFLGIASIAGGFALRSIWEASLLLGWLLALICQFIALIFALQWYRHSKSDKNRRNG